MILLLDSNSEIGAHVWSEIGNLICLRYLSRSKAVVNLKCTLRNTCFLHTCATCSELPSNLSAMILLSTEQVFKAQEVLPVFS